MVTAMLIIVVVSSLSLSASEQTKSTMTVKWVINTNWNKQERSDYDYYMYSRFTDSGSYDTLHAHAKTKSGKDTKAGSLDGGGQLVVGKPAYNAGDVSYADQGARAGLDVAYLYSY